MDDRLDVLYIHAPKFSSHYRPFDEYMFINFISMGLFALADLTEKAGYRSRIVHLGVEWIIDKGFSILEYIEKTRPRVVAVPLFWHPQAYDAISVMTAVKKRFPEITVITGGFTASYFAREAVEGFEAIDAVVRGHGEASIVPIVERAAKLEPGNTLDLSNIPNTVWKKRLSGGGFEVVENPETFVAEQRTLDELDFSNLSLLSNREGYMNAFRLNVAYSKRLSREENLRITPVRAFHIPLFVGRGCPVECKVCAGRNRTQQKVNNSGCVMMRSVDKVCETMRGMKEYGFEQAIVCYDPYPSRPDYFIELFRKAREKNIGLEMFFESWGLPTKDFIDEFGKTFQGRYSAIAISAESGSEEVRKKIRGYHFTNAELFETLDYLEAARVGFLVFFTVGNPFETEADLDTTFELITRIKENYSFARWITTYPVQIEPGSAIFEEPEKYGIEKTLYTLRDYYEFHGSPNSCLYTDLGYYIKGYFPDEPALATTKERVEWFSRRMSKTRCDRFCILHPDPDTARHYCDRFYDRYVEMGFGSPSGEKRDSFV